MKKYVGLLFLAAGLVMPLSLMAQSSSNQQLGMAVGSTSLIKIVNEATAGSTVEVPPTITLTLAGAGEAGEAVDATTFDESTRLRMTSYTVGANKRSISASLTAGNSALQWASSNTELKVGLVIPREDNLPNFANYGTQAGTGLKGMQSIASPTGVAGKVLADQIGTAWSGMTAGDGYVVRYEFSHVSTETPANPVTSATVTFTITGD